MLPRLLLLCFALPIYASSLESKSRTRSRHNRSLSASSISDSATISLAYSTSSDQIGRRFDMTMIKTFEAFALDYVKTLENIELVAQEIDEIDTEILEIAFDGVWECDLLGTDDIIPEDEDVLRSRLERRQERYKKLKNKRKRLLACMWGTIKHDFEEVKLYYRELEASLKLRLESWLILGGGSGSRKYSEIMELRKQAERASFYNILVHGLRHVH